MAAAAIWSLVADLSVLTLVYQEKLVSRCPFQAGLVVKAPGSDSTLWPIPPANGKPALVVSNAQIISGDNGGLIGIYKKANYALDFYAQNSDLLGWWSCQADGQVLTYPLSYTQTEISHDLWSRQLQYDATHINADNNSNGSFTHLILWSSSQSDTAQVPFTVRASIDQGFRYDEPKTIKSYFCQVNPYSFDITTVNRILSIMQSNSSLGTWIEHLPALIYDGYQTPANKYSTEMLAQTLNSMTMVVGGDDSVTKQVGPDDDNTYGCLILRTYISPFIFFLVALVLLALIALLIYWVSLLARLGPSIFSRSEGSSFNPIPDGLLSWMLQATRESSFGYGQVGIIPINLAAVPKKERDLKDWNFQVVDEQNGNHFPRLVKEGDAANARAPQMGQQGAEFADYREQSSV